MDAEGKHVALVHDWLTGMRGGEKCLEPVCRRWPQATLYTLIHKPGTVAPTIERLRIRPSFLNTLPQVDRYYRYLLPLMPLAAGWRIADAELVVSFSHAVAKSAHAPNGVPHVCYCFTPMRYAWHLQQSYFPTTHRWGLLTAKMVDLLLARLRAWDRQTARRVTHFVAISHTVRQRIYDCYQRQATVIYPPVDTEFYTPSHPAREDFYLVVSALAPYKRFDLAIEACRKLGRRLIVIGTGQHAAKLQTLAGPHVQFLGWQPDTVIRDYLRRAKALLFPGEEDFGIVPLEAQACGCPVIGLGRGGLTETVLPWGQAAEPTGVFFYEQTPDALCAAIEQFERDADRFDPRVARRQALRFRKERFERELLAYLDAIVRAPATPRRQAA
ncbi:MAG: glycosyltransferase [Gemmataceae bacterium]|nr:glycosyltransferase [Gemmata sp.]MDW8197425.1 glycosyltransferase [Gemmataceae bacterium]